MLMPKLGRLRLRRPPPFNRRGVPRGEGAGTSDAGEIHVFRCVINVGSRVAGAPGITMVVSQRVEPENAGKAAPSPSPPLVVKLLSCLNRKTNETSSQSSM
jgi:hypothetical protein